MVDVIGSTPLSRFQAQKFGLPQPSSGRRRAPTIDNARRLEEEQRFESQRKREQAQQIQKELSGSILKANQQFQQNLRSGGFGVQSRVKALEARDNSIAQARLKSSAQRVESGLVNSVTKNISFTTDGKKQTQRVNITPENVQGVLKQFNGDKKSKVQLETPKTKTTTTINPLKAKLDKRRKELGDVEQSFITPRKIRGTVTAGTKAIFKLAGFEFFDKGEKKAIIEQQLAEFNNATTKLQRDIAIKNLEKKGVIVKINQRDLTKDSIFAQNLDRRLGLKRKEEFTISNIEKLTPTNTIATKVFSFVNDVALFAVVDPFLLPTNVLKKSLAKSVAVKPINIKVNALNKKRFNVFVNDLKDEFALGGKDRVESILAETSNKIKPKNVVGRKNFNLLLKELKSKNIIKDVSIKQPISSSAESIVTVSGAERLKIIDTFKKNFPQVNKKLTTIKDIEKTRGGLLKESLSKESSLKIFKVKTADGRNIQVMSFEQAKGVKGKGFSFGLEVNNQGIVKEFIVGKSFQTVGKDISKTTSQFVRFKPANTKVERALQRIGFDSGRKVTVLEKIKSVGGAKTKTSELILTRSNSGVIKNKRVGLLLQNRLISIQKKLINNKKVTESELRSLVRLDKRFNNLKDFTEKEFQSIKNELVSETVLTKFIGKIKADLKSKKVIERITENGDRFKVTETEGGLNVKLKSTFDKVVSGKQVTKTVGKTKLKIDKNIIIDVTQKELKQLGIRLKDLTDDLSKGKSQGTLVQTRFTPFEIQAIKNKIKSVTTQIKELKKLKKEVIPSKKIDTSVRRVDTPSQITSTTGLKSVQVPKSKPKVKISESVTKQSSAITTVLETPLKTGGSIFDKSLSKTKSAFGNAPKGTFDSIAGGASGVLGKFEGIGQGNIPKDLFKTKIDKSFLTGRLGNVNLSNENSKTQIKNIQNQLTKIKAKLSNAQDSFQKNRLNTQQKTLQNQLNNQLTKQKTALQLKQKLVQRQKLVQPQRTSQVSKTSTKITFKVPTLLVPPLFKPIVQVPKKKVTIKSLPQSKVGYNTFVKVLKTNKLRKVNRVPITKTKSKDLGSYLTDHSLARTFKIKQTNKPAQKPKLKVPNSYYLRNTRKFREHIIRKGKRIPTPNKFIERKTKLLDTRSEVKRITVAKKLAELKRRSGLIRKPSKPFNRKL